MLIEEFFEDAQKHAQRDSLLITTFSYWTFNYCIPGTLAFYDGQRTDKPIVYYCTPDKKWYTIAVSREVKDKLWEIAGGKDKLDKYEPKAISMAADSFPMLNYDDNRIYALKIAPWKKRSFLSSLFSRKKTAEEIESRQKIIADFLHKAKEKCFRDFGKNKRLLSWEKILGKAPGKYNVLRLRPEDVSVSPIRRGPDPFNSF